MYFKYIEVWYVPCWLSVVSAWSAAAVLLAHPAGRLVPRYRRYLYIYKSPGDTVAPVAILISSRKKRAFPFPSEGNCHFMSPR